MARDASAAEIKRAFIELAKRFHPDTCREPDAASRFARIRAAYEILGDAAQRAQYDDAQEAQKTMHRRHDPFAWETRSSNTYTTENDFTNIFEGIFAEFTQRHQQNQQPADINVKIPLTFDEAILGTKKHVTYSKRVACSTCHGTGAAASMPRDTCRLCGGTGETRRRFNAFVTMAQTCEACNGTGSLKTACKVCKGNAFTTQSASATVQFAPGTENGESVRVSEGGGSSSSKSGTLIATAVVAPSAIFERKKRDVIVRVSVPLQTCILGGSVEVPAVGGGNIPVFIPPMTQADAKVTVRGRGVPSSSAFLAAGNLLVHVIVSMPRSLNETQRQLLERFAVSLSKAATDESSIRNEDLDAKGSSTGT